MNRKGNFMFLKVRFILKLLCVFLILNILPYSIKIMSYGENLKIVLDGPQLSKGEPRLVRGVNYIPLRPVLESLGWDVKWDKSKNIIECNNNEKSITFSINSNKLVIDNQIEIIDNPVIILRNKAYVPSKLIIDMFGIKVKMNKGDNLVIVHRNDIDNYIFNYYGKNNVFIASNGLIVDIYEPCSLDSVKDILDIADTILNSDPNEALKKYQFALDNISKDQNIDLYAQIMNGVGNAYRLISERENPQTNLKKAINSYLEAKIYYKNNFSNLQYSYLLINLSNSLKEYYLVSNEKEYLTKSKEAYQETLTVLSKSKPNQAINFSNVYYNLSLIFTLFDNTQNRHSSFMSSEKSIIEQLYLKNLAESPNNLAYFHTYIANLYNSMSDTNKKEEYLKKLIKYYENSLKTWTVDTNPANFAKINALMGKLYMQLFELKNDPEYVEKAKSSYLESLSIYTLSRYPYCYAIINYELGNIFMTSNDMIQARTFLENSLRVFNQKEYPVNFNLATKKIDMVR